MGGIVTDLDGARPASPGLYAVGECACTGLHGANRLASNSLSECFVFGRRAALAGLDEPRPSATPRRAAASRVAAAHAARPAQAVWRLAGLERDAEDLAPLPSDPHPLARLVAACALAREETRGSHARAEFPEPIPRWTATTRVLDASADTPSLRDVASADVAS